VINSCLKTLQTPTEEIKMDVLVGCYSVLIILYTHLTVQPLTFELSEAPAAT